MSDIVEPNLFAKWLDSKFIEWIAKTGKRRTVKEFANWLDIPRPLVSRYLNGSRIPSRKTADLIAVKLGSEVFDMLGMQRPDPILQKIQLLWDRFDEEQRKRIIQLIEEVESNKP